MFTLPIMVWSIVSRLTRSLGASVNVGLAAVLVMGAMTGHARAQCGVAVSGRYGGETTAVARWSSDTLLAARGTWLELLSLADPSAPASFSPPRRVALDAPAVKIALEPASPYAFVLMDNGNVEVVTISASPTLSIGSPVTIYEGLAVDIAVKGQYVFIAHQYDTGFEEELSSSIRVYDVSTGTPVRIAVAAPLLNHYAFDRLATVGNTLWAGMHEFQSSILGVEGYDISNPSMLTRVTSSLSSSPLGTYTRVSALTAIGNTLLLSYRHDAPSTGYEDWMRAVDVSNPASPVWHAAVDLNGFAQCMSSSGGLLRVSIHNSGVGMWNTFDPDAMVWLGAYFNTYPQVGQIIAGPSTDYWAGGRGGLMTMNASAPASPTVRSTLDNFPVGPSVVRQIGNTTVVLDYTLNTMRLYNYTLPESQQLRSSVFLPLYSELVELGTLGGGAQVLACVATDAPGTGDSITVYDITNPDAPFTRATITGLEPHLMSVTGSRLYVMTYAREFKIIELSQQPPAVRSTTPFGGDWYDYTCMTSWESGATKAVGLGTNPFGLWLIDTTNAVSPLVSGIWNPVTNYRVNALTKGNNYLYVSARIEGELPGSMIDTRLESLDVTSLTRPRQRWVSKRDAGAGWPGLFDGLTYVSAPAGKFLIGTRVNTFTGPTANDAVVYELPPGWLTNEAIPFPIARLALPHATGRPAASADGSRVLVSAGPAGLYQLASPTQWAPGFGGENFDQAACYGQTVQFTAIASGNPTNVTYQWYRFGPPLSGGAWESIPMTDGPTGWGSTISGATETTVVIASAHPTDRNYSYYAVATNSCGSTSSAYAYLHMCPGDFNCSGTVTVQDIFDFLGAFFGSDPSADFNGVGGVTVQDLFDYLAAYFSPCF